MIAEGVKLLDEKVPGWADHVDPDRLDMLDEHRCVLGQLFGTYMKGLASLLGRSHARAVACGFNCDESDLDGWLSERSRKGDALRRAWADEIKRRRP